MILHVKLFWVISKVFECFEFKEKMLKLEMLKQDRETEHIESRPPAD